MCLETSLLLEREVAEEGRGESLAQGKLEQSPQEPWGQDVGAWGQVIFHGKGVRRAGVL